MSLSDSVYTAWLFLAPLFVFQASPGPFVESLPQFLRGNSRVRTYYLRSVTARLLSMNMYERVLGLSDRITIRHHGPSIAIFE